MWRSGLGGKRTTEPAVKIEGGYDKKSAKKYYTLYYEG